VDLHKVVVKRISTFPDLQKIPKLVPIPWRR
jgi:hypothetical protein